jgi:hypothetical protein
MLITKSNISGTLRRYLLLKIISKAAPSREDLSSVFELTSTKIVEALRAQTVSFFLIEEGQIAHKHVYFSPALWDSDEALGIIMRLFTETEPITYESEWFTLRNARLHLRPYTQPHPKIGVAAVQSCKGTGRTEMRTVPIDGWVTSPEKDMPLACAFASTI